MAEKLTDREAIAMRCLVESFTRTQRVRCRDFQEALSECVDWRVRYSTTHSAAGSTLSVLLKKGWITRPESGNYVHHFDDSEGLLKALKSSDSPMVPSQKLTCQERAALGMLKQAYAQGELFSAGELRDLVKKNDANLRVWRDNKRSTFADFESIVRRLHVKAALGKQDARYYLPRLGEKPAPAEHKKKTRSFVPWEEVKEVIEFLRANKGKGDVRVSLISYDMLVGKVDL